MDLSKQASDAIAEIAAGEAVHQLKVTLKDVNIEIIKVTQTLLTLCTKKGILEERIRAVEVLIHQHSHLYPNHETTVALQNLHRVNREEEHEHISLQHNGC